MYMHINYNNDYNDTQDFVWTESWPINMYSKYYDNEIFMMKMKLNNDQWSVLSVWGLLIKHEEQEFNNL